MNNANQPPSLRLLEAWTAFSALALVAVTYALWFPRARGDSFPQVPLLEAFYSWPLTSDYIGSAVLVVGWLLVLFGWRKTGYAGVIFAGALLVCLNQHRLQPWHYQLLLFALIFSLVSPSSRLRALRWLVISVYVYSALGKFDFEFLHTVGTQFVQQLLLCVRLNDFVSSESRIPLAATLPAGELLLAIGLMFAKTRRLAGLGVCLLHLILLLLLGPWGLNHSWGVLLWNGHFIGVAIFLFVWSDPPAEVIRESQNEKSTPQLKTGDWLAGIVLVPALIMPISERFGLWDHWPSWALYAPHSSRAEVFVASSAVQRLPESLQKLISLPPEGTLWVGVPIERWSLETLRVPIYPQGRFQLGVARSLAIDLSTEFELRADLLGVAARWDGKRAVRRLEGMTALSRAAGDYFFCTRPRAVRGQAR